MNLPITDWQFWVVSAVVLAILAWAVRGVIAGRRKPRRSTRVTLTIDRRKPGE